MIEYNNYQGSLIDGLIKFFCILVYFYLFWAILCIFVKKSFNRELGKQILEMDLSEENLVLSVQQSWDRFTEKLSYTTLYKNQFKVK